MGTMRRLSLKFLGVVNEGNSTFPNLLTQNILKKLGISRSSRVFHIMRIFYRNLGSHIRLDRSFSFNGEDSVIARYLPETVGSYLDIGSGHPTRGSNTFRFYKRGWAGTTIDPLKKIHRLHQLKRRRDHQINACIGTSEVLNESVTFYKYPADDFSTTSENRYLELIERGILPMSTLKLPMIRINDLQLEASPKDPFFLDIDIEGNEFEILKSNDWSKFTPRVIAIEEWDSPVYKPTQIRSYLEKLGYILDSRTVITSIYVHQEYLATARFS
jgi:FkbM family methyltransferase